MQNEKAVFGAGCFWGVEHKFGQIIGVKQTRVGYAGGSLDNPDYQKVCLDTTGHAEVVEITFDSSAVSYQNLVEKFFEIHDPTTPNRQGVDVGSQYRSVIFYTTENQKEIAQKVFDNVQKNLSQKMVTEILPLSKFWEAEEYHQKYYEKNRTSCCSF